MYTYKNLDINVFIEVTVFFSMCFLSLLRNSYGHLRELCVAMEMLGRGKEEEGQFCLLRKHKKR